jgi:hypothetical protein
MIELKEEVKKGKQEENKASEGRQTGKRKEH